MGDIRPSQLKQSFVVLLAVSFHLFITCPAKTIPSQAAISAGAHLKVGGQSIVRRAAMPGQEQKSTVNERRKAVSRHPSLEHESRRSDASRRLPSHRNDASLLSVNSSEQFPVPGWLKVMAPEEAPPNEYLLFTWDAGGAWDGKRNDLDAEVGFEFVPEKDMNITAVARHVAGNYLMRDKGGLNLQETTNVTIWYVLPKGVKLPKDKTLADLELLSVSIGPHDVSEVGGKYKFKYLDEPLPVQANERYRITQTCRRGMKDVWFDGVAFPTDVSSYSLTECVKIKNGVHSDRPHEFPENMEHEYKSAGMLNVRFSSDTPCGMAIPINMQENAGGLLR